MKVRLQGANHLVFQCPGCKEPHVITVNSERSWKWNGSLEQPTFTPSVLVTSGHYRDHWKQGENCWCTYYAEHPEKEKHFQCQRCHSFVTDGRIMFLTDSTHALAGQTVELPEVAA